MQRPPAYRIRLDDQSDRYVYDEVAPFARHRAGTGARVATLVRRCEIPWDPLCYFHCPTANVPNMDGEWVWKLNSMDICIVTGETDKILEGSRQMNGILAAKGIMHRGDRPWWKVQIRSYEP